MAVISDEEKRWLAEERVFKSLSQAFIDRPTRIYGIFPHMPELGYTLINERDIAEIHIARLHNIMESLSEKERSFFRLGVFAHEALHQIFTNFEETDKIIDSYKRQSEKNIFSQVSNIVEDTRIEFFAHQAIGGDALSALQFTIKHIYLNSELGNETHPVSQALNALIQLGDMGIVRGKFTIPEAFELFRRLVPLFEKAVVMPVCADALKVSKEMCEIIFEYIDFEFEDYLEELFKLAEEKCKTGKGSDASSEGSSSGSKGSSAGSASKSKRDKAKETMDKLGIPESDESEEGSGGGEGDKSSEASSKGEKGEDGKGSSSGSSDETGDSGTGSSSDTIELDDLFGDDDLSFDEPSEEKDGDKEGSEGEDGESKTDMEAESGEKDESVGEGETSHCSLSAEELAEINAKLQEAFDKMSEDSIMKTDYSDVMSSFSEAVDEEEDAGKKADKAEGTDPYKDKIPGKVTIDDSFVNLIVNKKMKPCDITLYNEILSKVSALVNSTAKAIQRAIKQDDEDTERHTSGEVNLMRYHDETYTSARVFDKRKIPSNAADTCITILVDESGSMRGPRAYSARETAILLAEVCAKINVPCYIIGYSADEVKGCDVDLRHYVTWKNTKADRTSLVSIQARVENRDGATIRAATEISKKRREERKILFVLSDGAPSANGYRGHAAVLDTKNAIREARKIYEKVIGISIGNASTQTLHEMYGNDFISVPFVNDLPRELSIALKKMFK